jgi:hypothetical protein
VIEKRIGVKEVEERERERERVIREGTNTQRSVAKQSDGRTCRRVAAVELRNRWHFRNSPGDWSREIIGVLMT